MDEVSQREYLEAAAELVNQDGPLGGKASSAGHASFCAPLHLALFISPLYLLLPFRIVKKSFHRRPILQISHILGPHKTPLILKIENLIWDAVFSIAEQPSRIQDIISQLMLKIPWPEVQFASTEDRDWFRLSPGQVFRLSLPVHAIDSHPDLVRQSIPGNINIQSPVTTPALGETTSPSLVSGAVTPFAISQSPSVPFSPRSISLDLPHGSGLPFPDPAEPAPNADQVHIDHSISDSSTHDNPAQNQLESGMSNNDAEQGREGSGFDIRSSQRAEQQRSLESESKEGEKGDEESTVHDVPSGNIKRKRSLDSMSESEDTESAEREKGVNQGVIRESSSSRRKEKIPDSESKSKDSEEEESEEEDDERVVHDGSSSTHTEKHSESESEEREEEADQGADQGGEYFMLVYNLLIELFTERSLNSTDQMEVDTDGASKGSLNTDLEASESEREEGTNGPDKDASEGKLLQ